MGNVLGSGRTLCVFPIQSEQLPAHAYQKTSKGLRMYTARKRWFSAMLKSHKLLLKFRHNPQFEFA